MEDFYSPRSAASELLSTLCKVTALSIAHIFSHFASCLCKFIFIYIMMRYHHRQPSDVEVISFSETQKNLSSRRAGLLCQCDAGYPAMCFPFVVAIELYFLLHMTHIKFMQFSDGRDISNRTKCPFKIRGSWCPSCSQVRFGQRSERFWSQFPGGHCPACSSRFAVAFPIFTRESVRGIAQNPNIFSKHFFLLRAIMTINPGIAGYG